MPSRNVELTDHFDRFVDTQVETGRYGDAGEVLRAGLRLLEQVALEEQEKLTLLRSLASEGFGQLDQGRGIEISSDEQLADFVGKIGRRVASAVQQPTNGN